MAVTDGDSTWTFTGKGGSAPPWRSSVAAAINVETQRLTVWAPICLVVGIWVYFWLDREPPTLLAFPVFLCCLGVVFLRRFGTASRIAAIVLLGFSASQLRTQWVATPLLRAYSPGQTITGIVADVDVRGKARFSLTLEIIELSHVAPEEKPVRVLVQVTGKHQVPRFGETVQLQADLAPLPRPSQPDVFDYGRQLYFQSIGAVGRSKTQPVVLSQDVPLRFQLRRTFHDLRSAIGSRVRAAIPGPLGSFADALITGERAQIPRSMNTSLQVSGLFHILSISGLHMALVAGGAFWVLRALLALSPSLALQYPIKKWSAAFAIIVGAAYMLLADSGAATERSFIMIAVVFFAVLVDRPALSLQNLAVAAILILLQSPEQALAASFQMSFMAVMGLAAVFAWWQKYSPQQIVNKKQKWVDVTARKIGRVVVASLGTSLVAGTLSSIPALHHFGRMAPYGVVSNALALPVVSVVVMPMAMISVLLMPLGLEGLPLTLMGWGLKMVMVVSDWVATWPAASLQLPRMGATLAGLVAFTAALTLLPAGRLRWLALPCALATVIVAYTGGDRPIVLVDERAANVAVVQNGKIIPALPKGGEMSVSRWFSEAGDTEGLKAAVLRPAWTCTAQLCSTTEKALHIGFMLRMTNIFAACPTVEILIAQDPLRRRCRGKRVTIDRFDVWRNGAHAVYADGSVRTVKQAQGIRPWVYEPRARTKPDLR
jgi:competence protein ComEC